MSDTITDIESGIDKLEAMIKSLRTERDKAQDETGALRQALDDREMELLQCDEELQQTKQRCDEQIAESRRAMEEMENRLGEVASRVKNLLPLVTGQPSGSPDDRT